MESSSSSETHEWGKLGAGVRTNTSGAESAFSLEFAIPEGGDRERVVSRLSSSSSTWRVVLMRLTVWGRRLMVLEQGICRGAEFDDAGEGVEVGDES